MLRSLSDMSSSLPGVLCSTLHEVTKGRRVEVAVEEDNEIHESEGRVVGVDEFLLRVIHNQLHPLRGGNEPDGRVLVIQVGHLYKFELSRQ